MGKLVPERLKEIRERCGLSIAEAARRTGIERSIFWRYEHGDIVPTDPAVFVMALHLRTSKAYLCGETDDPAPDLALINVREAEDEEKLVTGYRKLTDEQKDLMHLLIRQLIRE